MKYLSLLATLVLSQHTAHAVESGVRGMQETEDEPSGLRETISSFLNSTYNTVQSIEIPTIPGWGEGGVLQTLTCDEETLVSAECNLLSGVKGVNVCRPLGGVNVTLCAPKVLGNYIGTPADSCGCCGGQCYTQQTQCRCACQDGRGVMVNHNLFKAFGRQVSWKACYTPTIAAQVMNARPEFTCWEGCPADVDPDTETDYDTPEGEVTIEESESDATDSNATEVLPAK